MKTLKLIVCLMAIGSIGCAASRKGQFPPDFQNDHLPVVQQYEQLKRDTVFKNAFEKKAEVCPLCQF